MEAIEFACVVDEIVKSLNIQIDADLVAILYDEYDCSYENYTLLELIHILRSMNVEIDCAWNKAAIIEMIQRRNLKIQQKKEPLERTVWKYGCERSTEYIETKGTKFIFCEGTVIQSEYAVLYNVDIAITDELISDDLPDDDPDSYKEVLYVSLYDGRHDDFIFVEPQEFIDMLDFDDVTIIQNRSYGLFISDEQEARWRDTD